MASHQTVQNWTRKHEVQIQSSPKGTLRGEAQEQLQRNKISPSKVLQRQCNRRFTLRSNF